MKKVSSLYKKYEEIFNYLVVGVLTTLVSIAIYAVCAKFFHINYMVSSVISWILSVLFAYFTNKKYVFKSDVKDKKNIIIEVYQFFKYRVFSFAIELLLMYVLVDIISIDDLIAKVIVQIIVIVLNYVFSKLFVFKK